MHVYDSCAVRHAQVHCMLCNFLLGACSSRRLFISSYSRPIPAFSVICVWCPSKIKKRQTLSHSRRRTKLSGSSAWLPPRFQKQPHLLPWLHVWHRSRLNLIGHHGYTAAVHGGIGEYSIVFKKKWDGTIVKKTGPEMEGIQVKSESR